MLPSTSPSEALACSPSSPWNLPSFTVESSLSSPCSFSLAKVRLSLTLTHSFLTIWCSGQTALFFFLLARAALTDMPTAFSMALRPFFPFQQAQYAQVFPLKHAPFCKLFAGLGITTNSATSLLLSNFRYVFTTWSSPPSFLLSPSLWQIAQELSSLFSCSLRLQWVPDTCLSRGTARLMS